MYYTGTLKITRKEFAFFKNSLKEHKYTAKSCLKREQAYKLGDQEVNT